MSDADWKRYKDGIIQAVVAGLDDMTTPFRDAAEAKARATFPGITYATFNGVYAIVDGDGIDQSNVVQAALSEVTSRNPGTEYTEAAPAAPASVYRLLGSVPTDYIDLLEADPGHAFLAKTLDDEAQAIMRAVEARVKGAV